MKSIGATECSLLRNDINAALAAVAQKHNLVVTIGRMTYTRDGGNMTTKLECAVKSDSGDVLSREATAFKANARFYGLQTDDLFKPFNFQGQESKIVGINTRKRNFPIICQRISDGRRFVTSASAVRAALGSPAQV